MENKKSKKLSLQKMKIAQLNRNRFSAIKGGTEIHIDFSNTDCHTDTCPDPDPLSNDCASEGKYGCSGGCRTNRRFCGGQL